MNRNQILVKILTMVMKRKKMMTSAYSNKLPQLPHIRHRKMITLIWWLLSVIWMYQRLPASQHHLQINLAEAIML